MGTTERREREKLELKTRILDAARELFVAEGYEAVTMRKIAERIEYSPTAIYAHFKDKDALIRELCEIDFHAFAQKFVDFLSIDDPIERMRRAGIAYVDFAVENPQQYQLMFMTKRPVLEQDTSDANDPARNAYAFLRTTVEHALTRNLLRPELKDPDVIAQTIWAALHGVVALQITAFKEKEAWMDWATLKDRRALMSEVILRGLARESVVNPTGARGSTSAEGGRSAEHRLRAEVPVRHAPRARTLATRRAK
jgi:AcrR family transcriptional regulator